MNGHMRYSALKLFKGNFIINIIFIYCWVCSRDPNEITEMFPTSIGYHSHCQSHQSYISHSQSQYWEKLKSMHKMEGNNTLWFPNTIITLSVSVNDVCDILKFSAVLVSLESCLRLLRTLLLLSTNFIKE
mgnify:CR=1 FL=1